MALVWRKVQRADSDFTGTVTGAVSGSATINGTGCSTVVTNAANGNTSHGITSVAFDTSGTDPKLNTTNAADGLLNSQVTLDKDANGNISLSNAGTGSISLDNSDVGLGNVTNDAQIKTDGSNAPNSLLNSQVTLAKDSNGVISLTNANSATISLDNGDVGLGNVTNDAQIKTDGSNAPASLTNSSISLSSSGGTVTLSGASTTNNTFDKSDVGLGNVDNDSTADILGGTLTGTVSSSANIGSTAASTVVSGASDGATAIGAFDTSGSTPILNVDNAAAGLKNSGISIGSDGSLSGGGGGQVTAAGISAIGTDGTGAPNSLKNDQISLSASNGTVTLSGASTTNNSFDKGDVGLGSVVNQAITVTSGGKLAFDGTAQTLDADSIAGSTKAQVEAAAVSTAETNILGGAPDALNTLDELAAALNDDASFNSTITNSIATKAPAPLELTDEDVDGDTTFSSTANNPANLSEGQTGYYNGDQYIVVDVS